jgi:hypothetical protein
MPKEQTNVKVSEDPVKQDTPKLKLVPSFEKEQDIKLSEINQELKLSKTDQDIVSEICPHYYTLKERYREYKNPDPSGLTDGIPLRIDRRHALAIFEAVLSQAATVANIKSEPSRIIKCFVYENDVRKTKIIIDKLVQGTKLDGNPTAVTTVRVGYYQYPKQFQQDLDGDWTPVNGRFEKVYYIDWDKELVEALSVKGNPYTKQYAVWHPNGVLRKYYRREQFLNMTDDEQIQDMEKPKELQVR